MEVTLWVRSAKEVNENDESLNPYSTGSDSLGVKSIDIMPSFPIVLILILLEVTLWEDRE